MGLGGKSELSSKPFVSLEFQHYFFCANDSNDSDCANVHLNFKYFSKSQTAFPLCLGLSYGDDTRVLIVDSSCCTVIGRLLDVPSIGPLA